MPAAELRTASCLGLTCNAARAAFQVALASQYAVAGLAMLCRRLRTQAGVLVRRLAATHFAGPSYVCYFSLTFSLVLVLWVGKFWALGKNMNVLLLLSALQGSWCGSG